MATSKIVAPNAEITDDSKDSIVSRTCKRLQTLGFEIDFVGVDDWQKGQKPGLQAFRIWEIVITKGGEEIGAVTIEERKVTWFEKIPHRGQPIQKYATNVVFGYESDAVRTALGLETTVERAERAQRESARSDRENEAARRAARR